MKKGVVGRICSMTGFLMVSYIVASTYSFPMVLLFASRRAKMMLKNNHFRISFISETIGSFYR